VNSIPLHRKSRESCPCYYEVVDLEHEWCWSCICPTSLAEFFFSMLGWMSGHRNKSLHGVRKVRMECHMGFVQCLWINCGLIGLMTTTGYPLIGLVTLQFHDSGRARIGGTSQWEDCLT
jgi:hypothetical protein